MFSPQLEKIIDLAKRTGDKMIVMPEFGEPFAIVPIDQYEKIFSNKVDYAGMTEEEILNRANREISLWKQAQREIGLSDNMDFFSPRDLGGDYMPRLPFDKDEEFPWMKEYENDDDEDIFGKKTFDPLAGEDDDKDEGDESNEKDKWKIDESVFPAEDEALDDEWLNEEVAGDVNYEAEKTTEVNKDINKDLPIIEADEESLESEPDKKNNDEFLVEPIE
jgi:hypothetical protein